MIYFLAEMSLKDMYEDPQGVGDERPSPQTQWSYLTWVRTFQLNLFIPKKVELLIRFFLSHCGYRGFFHFSLMFEEVEHLPAPLVASDKTYTQSKIDISGSNETMQNALASIVQVWRIFEIFFMFREFQKFELLYFSSDLGEICYGG